MPIYSPLLTTMPVWTICSTKTKMSEKDLIWSYSCGTELITTVLHFPGKLCSWHVRLLEWQPTWQMLLSYWIVCWMTYQGWMPLTPSARHYVMCGQGKATSNGHISQKEQQVRHLKRLMFRSLAVFRADDAAKMTHKRAASSRVIPVPEKHAKKSESDFKQRKKAYEKEVTLLAAQSTCLEKNQCSCGEVFNNDDQLETHMATTQMDPKAWVCPKCKENPQI